MNSLSYRLCNFVVIASIVMLGGCGAGRVVLPVHVDAAAVAAAGPVDPRTLTTTDAAVHGIATIFEKDLHLPLPDRFSVYVYSGRDAFERGLVQDAQVSPIRAAELSEFAVGIGKWRQLLLNEDASRPSQREWLRLIAHELTHVSQIEMAGGEGRAEQWLAEGMAEWVAFTVLERLGLDTMTHRRALAVAGIRSHASLIAARLDLETLGNPRGFTVRHLRDGSLPTYQLAYLMADYLITRNGFDRVVQYFASFSHRQDRHANFQQAFGQTLQEFEQEVLAHLKTVVQH